jgi:hypothetical protein
MIIPGELFKQNWIDVLEYCKLFEDFLLKKCYFYIVSAAIFFSIRNESSKPWGQSCVADAQHFARHVSANSSTFSTDMGPRW